MKRKYYIPELSDFGYGLEFEYLDLIWESGKERQWNKFRADGFRIAGLTIYHNTISIGGFTVKPEDLRVKYLDREDIESLGWMYYEPYPPDKEKPFFRMPIKDNMGEYNDCSLIYNLTSHWALVTCHGPKVDPVDRFSGYIKNKSELKKLMKQLNIYEKKNISQGQGNDENNEAV